MLGSLHSGYIFTCLNSNNIKGYDLPPVKCIYVPVAYAAVGSKAVVLLLLTCCLLLLPLFVGVILGIQYLVSFLTLQSFILIRKGVYFTLIVFFVFCDCFLCLFLTWSWVGLNFINEEGETYLAPRL